MSSASGPTPLRPLPSAQPRSPCTGICRLDSRGQCQGCQRTLGEIAAWMTMPTGERDWLMDIVLPARSRGDAT